MALDFTDLVAERQDEATIGDIKARIVDLNNAILDVRSSGIALRQDLATNIVLLTPQEKNFAIKLNRAIVAIGTEINNQITGGNLSATEVVL